MAGRLKRKVTEITEKVDISQSHTVSHKHKLQHTEFPLGVRKVFSMTVAQPWGQAQKVQVSILTGFLTLPVENTQQPEGQVLLGLGGTITRLQLSTSF